MDENGIQTKLYYFGDKKVIVNKPEFSPIAKKFADDWKAKSGVSVDIVKAYEPRGLEGKFNDVETEDCDAPEICKAYGVEPAYEDTESES